MKMMRSYACAVMGTCGLLAALAAQPAQAAEGKTYFKFDAGAAFVQDIEVNQIGGVLGAATIEFPYTFTITQEVIDELAGWPYNLNVPTSLLGSQYVIDKPKFTLDPGFRFDLVGGYKLNETIALELEVGFIFSSVDTIEVSASPANVTAVSGILSARPSAAELDMNYYQIPVFLNGVYTVKMDSKFKPFGGVGIGGIYSLMTMDVGPLSLDESDFTFAYQAMVGVKYELSEKVDLGLSYKFMGTLEHDFSGLKTDAVFTNSAMAQFTYHF